MKLTYVYIETIPSIRLMNIAIMIQLSFLTHCNISPLPQPGPGLCKYWMPTMGGLRASQPCFSLVGGHHYKYKMILSFGQNVCLRTFRTGRAEDWTRDSFLREVTREGEFIHC